jgi:hypothetical protein
LNHYGDAMTRIRSRLLVPILAALGSLCAAHLAGATTINFSPLTLPGSGFNDTGPTYSQDGFTFTGSLNPSSPNDLGAFLSSDPSHPVGGSTTTSLTAFYASTTVTMTPTSGTFDLQSIDLAQYGANQGAGSGSFVVTFTGTQFGGGTVVQAFTVPMVSGSPVLGTYDFSGFTDLTQVAVLQGFYSGSAATGTSWQFDNIVVSSPVEVPEPSSLITFLTAVALAGAGVLRVRRKRSGSYYVR